MGVEPRVGGFTGAGDVEAFRAVLLKESAERCSIARHVGKMAKDDKRFTDLLGMPSGESGATRGVA